ncbi:hypothetical protein ACV35V_34675, partial [Pseudomonas aeruginosa]
AETLPPPVPLPPEPRWLALCEAFLVEPDIRAGAERWAGLLHTSLRSFNRTFRRYTGLSFGAWKQRACVVQALARLAEDPAEHGREGCRALVAAVQGDGGDRFAAGQP